MDLILQDLRHSLRSLKKSALFTGTAIFCLTLSIGAVSSIFSVFNAVVLDAFPFEEPDGLVDIQLIAHDFQFDDPNDFTFTLPQRTLDPFMTPERREVYGWKADRGFAITDLETPISVNGDVVSTNYFDLVQPEMRLGRLFNAEDKDAAIAIISYRQWTTTFGRDPNILGKTLTFDGESHTIVGVLERDHRYPSYSDLWVPEKSLVSTGSRLDSRMSYNIMARLQPGQSIEQQNEELEAISNQLMEVDSGLFSRYRLYGFPVTDLLARGAQLGDTLRLLLAAVVALLLIASANVANLMLSRMQQQEQELSMRAALGARRGRLVRRLLMESGVIALISAVLGVLLAFLMLPLFVEQAGQLIQNPERVRIDATVMIFSVLVTIVTTLFVSLAPLFRVLTTDLASTLRAGGNKGMMGGGSYLRQVLVTAEAALTFMLLVGAGLMIKSFDQIQSVDMGFDQDNQQTIILYAPPSRSVTHAESMAFYQQIQDELEARPEIDKVAYSFAIPVGDRSVAFSMTIEDFPPEDPTTLIEPAPVGSLASSNYMEVMGVELLEGRYLNSQDREGGHEVVLITENMAKYHWPNESAIGKRIKRGAYADGTHPWWTVVGVVEDIRPSPTIPAQHRFIRSVEQNVLVRNFNDMRMVIRTNGEPGAAMPVIRDVIRNVAVDAVIANELTMNERIANVIRTQQMAMQIVLAFSLVGLILAVAGIFGVFSYNVQQRFREIGLRMVLGARHTNIFTLVLKSAIGLGALGLGIGLMLSLSARNYLETYLYQVSGIDPAVYLIVTVILLTSIIAAACVPARKATMMDPVDTLRHS